MCLFVGTEDNNIYNFQMGEIIEQSKIDKAVFQAQTQTLHNTKRNRETLIVDDQG